MGFFNKKDTLTKTITFMAIMAAINIVLSLIGAFVPFSYIFLIIVMPLTSALVEILCKDRYFPIYAFGTVGLSIAATFWNLDFTIFYLVPSILTGYIFGLMSKKKFQPLWSILIASLVQTGVTFALIPLIKLVSEHDLIDDLITIFNLTGWTSFSDYLLLIIFGVSLVQIILSYIVVSGELKKLGFEKPKTMKNTKFMEFVIFGLIGLSILSYFLYKGLSYLIVGLSMFFAFFVIMKTCKEKAFKKLIIYLVILVLNIFFFSILNPIMSEGQFLLIGFSPLFIGIISLISIY